MSSATVVLEMPDGTRHTLTKEYSEETTKIVSTMSEAVEFMWMEGNDSCDCNRRLYLGLEPGPCTRDIKLVSLTLDGLQLVADGKYLINPEVP